jgi:methionyl-tRNA formyltransferase
MIHFAFFGTDEFAVSVLETLRTRNLIPSLIITTPDRPKGRKLTLTPPQVKVWAQNNHIEISQPEKLKDESFFNKISGKDWDLFIVAAYGKLIPENIFNLPKHKTLNIHPSLLPILRGPSPVATAILNDIRNTGVTVMQIDKEMDHGAIISQKAMHIDTWPNRDELEKSLAIEGANLLADTLPNYLNGKLASEPQDDAKASYCRMITKDMGLTNLNDLPYDNWRKIQALHGWPGTFFYTEHTGKQIRVSIRKAHYQDNVLTIETVVPEGKKEMLYQDFLRGL